MQAPHDFIIINTGQVMAVIYFVPALRPSIFHKVEL
jgi:hypothetical protein